MHMHAGREEVSRRSLCSAALLFMATRLAPNTFLLENESGQLSSHIWAADAINCSRGGRSFCCRLSRCRHVVGIEIPSF